MHFFPAAPCEPGAKASTACVPASTAGALYFALSGWSGLLVLAVLLATGFLTLNAMFSKITPSRLNPRQAPRSMYGLIPAMENPPPREGGVDIIFVHGLASNPDTTWLTKRKTPPGDTPGDKPAASTAASPVVNWVTDLFPDDIPDELRKCVRIFYYNYDSYWQRDAKDNRLSLLADELLDHINVSIRSTAREKSRKLMFVAHCYGGLVIKQALVSANDHIKTSHITQQTIATVFLGTPHKGTSFSTLGRIQARLYRSLGLGSSTVLLSDLADNSAVLMDLHRHYANLVGKRLRAVNFYEQFGNVQLSVWLYTWRQIVVSEASATFFSEYVDNVGLGTDHRGLIKFGCRDNEYRRVCSKLLQVLEPHAKPDATLFSVPLELARKYTQRQTLQEQIEEALQVDGGGGGDFPHAVAITGMGGTGKSQLALSFAAAHTRRYNPVLWIDATSAATVRTSFQRCFDDIGAGFSSFGRHRGTARPDASAPADLASTAEVRSVLGWLKSRSAEDGDDPWLVVVDNADDLSWGIGSILPKGACGSIIITSQDIHATKLTPTECRRVRVDTMDAWEASTLLLKHMGRDREDVSETVLKQCGALAEKLGCLALAVGIAGCQIANEEDPEAGLAQYIADYDSHCDRLLKTPLVQGLTSREKMREKTIWTTWDASLERIETLHNDGLARMLLMWLAHFRGTTVYDAAVRHVFDQFLRIYEDRDNYGRIADGMAPELKQLTPFQDGEWDDFCFRASCRLLVRYGLVQRTKDPLPGVAMHKLVQWRALQEAREADVGIVFFTAFDIAFYGYERFPLDERLLAASAPGHADVLAAIGRNGEQHDAMTGYGIESMYARTERYVEHAELIACMTRVAAQYDGDSARGGHSVHVLNMAKLMAIRRQRWDDAVQCHERMQPLLAARRGPLTAEFLGAASLCAILVPQKKIGEARALSATIEDGITNRLVDLDVTLEEMFRAVRAYANWAMAAGNESKAKSVWAWMLDMADTREGAHSALAIAVRRAMTEMYIMMRDWEAARQCQQAVAEAIQATQGASEARPTAVSLRQLHIMVPLHIRMGQFDEAAAAAAAWLQQAAALGTQGTSAAFIMLTQQATAALLTGRCEEGKARLDACLAWLATGHASPNEGVIVGMCCATTLMVALQYARLAPQCAQLVQHIQAILAQRHADRRPTSAIVDTIRKDPPVRAQFDAAFLDSVYID